MDVIQDCLSLVPVPYLSPAFSLFRFVYGSIEQIKETRAQLRVLTSCIAQLLCSLDIECRTKKHTSTDVAKPLQDLCRLLEEIDVFVRKQSSCHFLKALFKKDEWISQIAGYHRQIESFVAAFQISVQVDIMDWQERNDHARLADQQSLHDRLTKLEGNLAETLDIQHNSMMAMMASLQRQLNAQLANSRELQFYKNSLQYLCTVSGTHVILEDWMISSFDVDFGPKIGEGGFGAVFRGTWNKMPIALKVLTTDDGISPTSAAIRREIKIWSDLRHPHILQFLGANILDDKPFIVMPLVKNGNARDFIDRIPDCDRQKILYHISLGLVYLHSRNIVHGDLKLLNVLIDDGENAVLCDFGLSRIKADVASRTVKQTPTAVTGSRNWMAPERFRGGSLKKPCDIYAFGMVIYEVHTNEIPLGHIPYSEFVELVGNQNVRPERPDFDEAPHMTDESWQLAELCWRQDPLSRPNIGTVCDTISRSLCTTSGQQTTGVLCLDKDLRTPFSHYLQPQPLPTSPVMTRCEVPVAQLPTPSPPPKLRPAPHTFQETCRLKGHTDIVFSVAFSPDGERIASGSYDKTLLVWDWRNEKVVLEPLRDHTNSVRSVGYSPDGQQIVSGSDDNTVIVWDAKTGNRLHRLARHTRGAGSVAFSPDGRVVASGSHDKTIRIWDATTGNIVQTLMLGSSVWTVVFSPNGQHLVAGTIGRVEVWDVQSWKRVRWFYGGLSVAVTPDSKQVAYTDKTSIRIMDLKTPKLIVGPIEGHKGDVKCLAFSPDGRWIASGSYDKTIRIWDTGTGNQISMHQFGSEVQSIAVSPNGMQIVACGGSGNPSDDYSLHLYSCDSVVQSTE